MIRRSHLRALLLAIVVCSVLAVGWSWANRPAVATAPDTANGTVITAQGREHLVDTARIIAYGPNGSVLYEDRKFDTYFDVDPVPNSSGTVEYIGVDYEPPEDCPPEYTERWCAKNYLLQTDLRTNETTVVFMTILPRLHKLHDIDRVNDTHWVVADIYRNQVRMVTVRGKTPEPVWVWDANQSFGFPDSGGPPDDWTHLNDVEVVRDGWVMVSLRNHDQVVFLDPGSGVVGNWTLGCDDCHDVLYEQHNPDYLPTDPPVVIVADSENDRIVEYRRTSSEWLRTWTWTDEAMKWPRDADRLPNGNTLVTDSDANRVVEIARNGSIVWEVTIGNPYEAERLGTGDESSSLPHHPGTQTATDGPVDELLIAIRELLPSKLLSAALFVAPYWIGLPDLLVLAVGTTALASWLAIEAAWFLRGRVSVPDIG